MRIRTLLLGTVAFSAIVVSPATGQSDFWKDRWFWGAQAGATLFTAGGSTEVAATVGPHWFITAGQSALYLAFDQMFISDATTSIGNGTPVTFNQAQRFQASVFAMPSVSNLQILLGAGFALTHVTNAETTVAPATPQQAQINQALIDDFATKAFAVLSAGVQYRWKTRWVVFGQYQWMPSTNDFLITSDQHAFSGGLRYALTGAKDNVTGR